MERIQSHSTLDLHSALDSHSRTTEQDVSNSTKHNLTALRATITSRQEALDVSSDRLLDDRELRG